MGVCHSSQEDYKIFCRLKYTDYYDFKPNKTGKDGKLEEIDERNSESSRDCSESPRKKIYFESQTENLEENEISEKKTPIVVSSNKIFV